MGKTTSLRTNPLAAAHRGYVYQDLLTAYLLVQGLISGFNQIVVDKKVVEDDRFDDVETCISGRRLRRQIKSSANTGRCLSFSDFNDAASTLRFDRLVRTFVDETPHQANEYRLCATWEFPKSGDPLVNLLKPADMPGTLVDFDTMLMRFDVPKLWTGDGSLIFPNARPALVAGSGLCQADVLSFCERFVIEIELPQASLDLEAPGPLERLLLSALDTGIGIGRYPNDARRVEDVAALAIYVAMTGRTAGETLTKADLVRRLDIRTDFGRIAQAYPLDRAVMQDRGLVRKSFANAVMEGGIHFLLAGPGSGKSWMLTQLAEDLEAAGAVVARHYCFLEPGDELVERRVTTDVFFGNLIGELSDSMERREIAREAVFAAGLDELERMLLHAAQDGRHVVVIVDGMDHIARVVAGSNSLSDAETDIVERLATVRLPDKVSLVVGSQPGQHLDPIRVAYKPKVVEHSLPSWSNQEIEGLAIALGISAALDHVALTDDESRRAVLSALAERAEGNPLYARYLTRSLIGGLSSARIVSPGEWLGSAPVIEGDISRYYQHLLDSVSRDAQAIADVLGVLDFAVTPDEVKEIVGPLLEDRVPEALTVLSPVLSQAAAQGGVRVFHESFRRFMMTAIQHRGTSLANILKPVAQWLESKDFFIDAKSYRFMLPMMRRSGREAEILQKVAADFVYLSVEHGHPEDAIQRNLALAADVAARSLDWPSLLRIAELSRALDACYSEGNNDWEEYWQTFLAIFGPQATSDRLLFDGRPTLSRSEGLSVCAAVDTAGAPAPWREYLSLPFSEGGESYTYDFDELGALSADEETYLAAIYGRLRLGHHCRVVRSSLEYLSNPDGNVTSRFIRKFAQLMAEQGPAEVVRQLVKRATPTHEGRFRLSPKAGCALLLGLSDVASKAPEFCGPQPPYASLALALATTPDEVLRCLDAGAPLEAARNKPVKLAELNAFLSEGVRQAGVSSMRTWLSTVRLLARTEEGRVEVDELVHAARGEGWYLCWVRFALRVAIAEGLAAEGAAYDAVSAFRELNVDMRPFVGSPRACDLYFIHGLINESLERGLSLLRAPAEWNLAVDCIAEARNSTATRLDREDGGPITAGAFFSILLSHAKNPQASVAIIQALEKMLADEEESGTYYSTHALFRMRLAQLHAATGNTQVALGHWQQAAKLMTCYTFHKDGALFDIVQSVVALKSVPGKAALHGLVKLQPLLSAVLRHTDQRETQHAPNAWFKALLKVDSIRAAVALSQTFVVDPGRPSWIALKALRDLLREVSNDVDPLIADALWETLLFEIEYDGEGEKMVNERLVPLERLASSDPTYMRDRFTRLCGQAQNDSRGHASGTAAPLQAFSERHGLQLQQTGTTKRGESSGARDTVSRPIGEKPLSAGVRPAFTTNPEIVSILATVRRIARAQVSEEDMYGLLTLPLSYMLTEMVERGEEAQTQRVIYFLVHEATGWNYSTPHPIGVLARCLDNAGHQRIAAVAYVLAFTTARGGGGRLTFGDHEHSSKLQRAFDLDRSNALQALAGETARKLRVRGFQGLTMHLIQQIALWDEPAVAMAAWEEAFLVMEARLPMAGNATYFEPLDINDGVDWSLDEGLTALLLARSGDPTTPRRITALSGLVRLIEKRPDVLPRPIRWFITGNATVATVQAVLQLLLESPWDVSSVIAFNEDVLRAYAKSRSWSLSMLAVALLSKIGINETAARMPHSGASEPASHRGRVLASMGDAGAVLPRLAQLWPELPGIVARRMQRSDVDNESFNRIGRERYELEKDRHERSRPRADVLSWPSELVIAILDDVLCGLPDYLWRTGQWKPAFDYELLWAILPDLETRLASHASLGPRPPVPLHTEDHRLLGPVVRVAKDDPSYGSWIRLAAMEVHFFRSDDRHWDAPNRSTLFAAGVVRTEIDGTVPLSAGPFGASDMWPWREEYDRDEALEDARRPQLVKKFATTDWLGQCGALVPPLALRLNAELIPPAFGAPLRWADKAGKAAVVLRTWRLRGQGLDVESYATQGCELLLRPDLEEILHSTFGGPLKDLSRVQLIELKEDA
ncbi:ATP-binding protein [Limnohabitans sp.]|uniref:ATP-binding protein n=1 Tax=Limnohabitans sp. TaxID=1907725 RepID=UPI0025BBBCEB|nr:ATP-binding protein [Limnohabitans sp.]